MQGVGFVLSIVDRCGMLNTLLNPTSLPADLNADQKDVYVFSFVYCRM